MLRPSFIGFEKGNELRLGTRRAPSLDSGAEGQSWRRRQLRFGCCCMTTHARQANNVMATMASLGAILPGARLGLMVHALVALPRSLALPASLFYAAYCLHRQTGRQNRRFLKIGGPMDELGLIFLVKKPFFVIGNGANTSESTIAIIVMLFSPPLRFAVISRSLRPRRRQDTHARTCQ